MEPTPASSHRAGDKRMTPHDPDRDQAVEDGWIMELDGTMINKIR